MRLRPVTFLWTILCCATLARAGDANGIANDTRSISCEILPDHATTVVPKKLTLDQAEELFVKNNLAVITARYGVDVSIGLKIIAAYIPNPQVTLSAEQFSLVKPFFKPFKDRGTIDENFYTGRVDQVFEAPGRRKYRTNAAIWQVEASKAQVEDAIRTNLFQVRQFFYSAVLAHENLLVAEENLRTISETENKIQNNVKGGNTAEADLARFQVGKVQFENDRVTDKLNYVQAVRSLINLLAAEGSAAKARQPATSTPATDADVEIVGELAAKTLDLDLFELRSAIDTRSDVLAAKCAVNSADDSVHYAKVGKYPDLTLGMEYQRNGPGNTVGLALQLPLPIFHNQQGEIKQAGGQLSQAEATYKQTRLQALTDVDNGFKAYEAALALQNVYTSETIDKAKEAYRVARVTFEQGLGSRLDVLDAQRQYNAIRVAANQAHYNLLIAIYQLEQATGKKLLTH